MKFQIFILSFQIIYDYHNDKHIALYIPELLVIFIVSSFV